MKTIYSLKEFHEKATEISGKASDLVSVSAELCLYGRWEFSCYVVGYKFYKASTIEESLKKLHDAINPQPTVNESIEVEIEVEQETETI
jgi:hypothetical protein